MNGPDDCTDTSHVKKEIFADKVITKSTNLVSYSYGHILLRCNMGLICRYFENVTLIQVNFFILVCLAKEQL